MWKVHNGNAVELILKRTLLFDSYAIRCQVLVWEESRSLGETFQGKAENATAHTQQD